ncbi:hypothetical protein OEZ86_011916 [Tetradesmus obliquus]|uniref:ABM domain-containing protein n=1 Tax=Tetradesmus obliquus TaxID=3088 RepID=A0A383V4A0_TETOB|nr:hypothetical protein OEZ86_011916 [Tetradesmus obliquus]|eukprot:jgi/Sobl393_1/15328/SZX60428.1
MALVTSGMLRSQGYRTLQTRSAPARPQVCRPVVAQAGPNGATAPAAAKQAKPVAAPAAKEFTNINKFIVPKPIQQAFVAAWRQREADMQGQPGFMGFNVISEGDSYTVSSSWASIPEWEAWSLSEECRRSHLPQGIWQFVPAKGEGFPEDFVPFKNYDEPVNAKY